MDPKEKIILALDVDDFEEAQRLVLEFRDYVGCSKSANSFSLIVVQK